MSEITNRVLTNVTGIKEQRLFVAKKLINSQKYFVSMSSRNQKPAAKNFLRQKKVYYFLSKYETFSNTKNFVLFSTLACLIVRRRGGEGGQVVVGE